MNLPNTPVVQQFVPHVNGYEIFWQSNTTLSVTPGSCNNSGNNNDIIKSGGGDLLINGLIVGPNGVDAPLVASQFYSIYAIGDSTAYLPTAMLLSLNSNIAPSLPFGYDQYRRIGYVKTDGSSNFVKFYQYGSGISRVYYWDTPISISTPNVTSFTTVNLNAAGAVPLLLSQSFNNDPQTIVSLDITYTPAVATSYAAFRTSNSSAANGTVRYGCGVAGAQVGSVFVPTQLVGAAPALQYRLVAGDTLVAAVASYTDYLG